METLVSSLDDLHPIKEYTTLLISLAKAHTIAIQQIDWPEEFSHDLRQEFLRLLDTIPYVFCLLEMALVMLQLCTETEPSGSLVLIFSRQLRMHAIYMQMHYRARTGTRIIMMASMALMFTSWRRFTSYLCSSFNPSLSYMLKLDH